MKQGLEGLEGAKNVKLLSFKRGHGTYRVTVDEKAAVTFGAVQDTLPTYPVERIDLSLVGTAEKGEKGLVFVARGSKAKYALADRKKKDGEKEAPKIVAKIEDFLKDGSKLVQVKGALVSEDEKDFLELDGAEVVKADDKKK